MWVEGRERERERVASQSEAAGKDGGKRSAAEDERRGSSRRAEMERRSCPGAACQERRWGMLGEWEAACRPMGCSDLPANGMLGFLPALPALSFQHQQRGFKADER